MLLSLHVVRFLPGHDLLGLGTTLLSQFSDEDFCSGKIDGFLQRRIDVSLTNRACLSNELTSCISIPSGVGVGIGVEVVVFDAVSSV